MREIEGLKASGIASSELQLFREVTLCRLTHDDIIGPTAVLGDIIVPTVLGFSLVTPKNNLYIHCYTLLQLSLIHQTEPSANPTAPSHVLRLTVLQEVGVGTRISSDWWSVRFL